MNELLAKRRDRAIAIVLSVKEREADTILRSSAEGRAASDRLRKVVLDQFNDLTDVASHLLMANDAGMNELFLEKLEQIYQAVSDG